MGWKYKLVDQFGATHDDAYANISTFSFDRRSKSMNVTFDTYHSEAAKDAGKQPLPNGQITISIGKEPRALRQPVIDPNTGETITPGVYLPTYDEILGATAETGKLFDGVAKAAYSLSTLMPQFKNAINTETIEK